VSDVVANNLLRIRKDRRLTTQQLADRLKELGQPIPASGITRIEKGDRRVDVDDLMALAVALNVAPTTLLLPPTSSNAPAPLTATCSVTSRTAWQWAEGEKTASDWMPGAETPLAEPGANPAISTDAWEAGQEFARQQADYLALAQPEERRRAAKHSTVRLAKNLTQVIQELVIPESGMEAKNLAALGRMAWRRHQQLGIELDEIRENLPPAHPGVERISMSAAEVQDTFEQMGEIAAEASRRAAADETDEGSN
jgi:transcriptional regulator with XRE-family HTH domain